MLRRFPYVRTLAMVCVLSLTVQVAAPVLASLGNKGGGRKDSFLHFL